VRRLFCVARVRIYIKISCSSATFYASHSTRAALLELRWNFAHPMGCQLHPFNERERNVANDVAMFEGIEEKMEKMETKEETITEKG
jgi:hypothetical protein